MSFNGSGTYSLPSGNPVVGGSSISSTWANTTFSDLSSALTNALCKDGQSTPTANLRMGSYKFTGLGVGISDGDSIRFEQLFGQGAPTDIASSATTDIGAVRTNFLTVTGTTTITSFGSNYNGPKMLRFTGALTLTHDATVLVLPGAANITTAANDTCILVPKAVVSGVSDGWIVLAYQRASGAAGGGAGASGQVFTSSGTFTIPTGVTALKVTVVGGGGGGGDGVAGTRGGSGGGAGGTATSYLTGLTPGGTLAIVIGAGGAVSSAGGNTTVASGTQSITTITGGGGPGSSGTYSPGGGTAVNGTINIGGGSGSAGTYVSGIAGGDGGTGGASSMGGGGGGGVWQATTAGIAATAYGAGGGGGYTTNAAAGKSGVVIFEW